MNIIKAQENQEEVRDALFTYLATNPMSLREISDAIGIGINTVCSFKKGKDIRHFKPLAKILRFLESVKLDK